MIIEGVIAHYDETVFSEEEIKAYIGYCRARLFGKQLKKVTLTLCADGKVDIDYETLGVPFERIRRITGYLTGDLNSWNNAKRSEESERVKHTDSSGGEKVDNEGYFEGKAEVVPGG